MSMRAILTWLVLAIAVLGCRADDVSTDVNQAPGAVAAPAPPVSGDGGQRAGARPLCDAAAQAELRAGVGALGSDAATARAHFERSGMAMAEAYLAYLAQRDGRRADAEARFQQVIRELRADGAGDYVGELMHPAGLKGALQLVRGAFDHLMNRCGWAGGPQPRERDVVACALFEQHPREASEAFAPRHGSTMDNFAYQAKQACVVEIAGRHAGRDRAAAVVDADFKIRRAMFAVAEPPLCDAGGSSSYCGTIWHGRMAIAAGWFQDALLSPESVDASAPDDAALSRLLPPGDAAMSKRLAQFRAARDRWAPVLAEGICAISRGRGSARGAGDCRAMARATANRAMADWIEMYKE